MASSDDSLLDTLQREKDHFFASNLNLNLDEAEAAWALRVNAALGATSVKRLHVDRPRSQVGPSRRRRRTNSDRTSPLLGTSMQRQASGHGYALVRTENFSQRSAPAAFPLTRSFSHGLEQMSTGLDATAQLHQSPTGFGVNPNNITAWQQRDPPFNPYSPGTRSTQRRLNGQPWTYLSQVDEDPSFGEDPSVWLSRNPLETIDPTFSQASTVTAEEPRVLSYEAPDLPSMTSAAFDPPNWSGSHSTAGLTTATTVTSDSMSRQPSLVSNLLCDDLEMMRFASQEATMPPSIGNEELSALSQLQNYPSVIDRLDEQTGVDISYDLRGAGAVGDVSKAGASTIGADAFGAGGPVAEDMQRSTSRDSQGSSSSAASNLARRRKQILNGRRSIAPKPSAATALSNGTMTANLSNARRAIAKVPSRRQTQTRLMCPKCDERPNGFSGQHELNRHDEREHRGSRKVWRLFDASSSAPGGIIADPPLRACKHCRDGKVYAAPYNAAAHLRRKHLQHLNPTASHQSMGGNSGGKNPPLEQLRDWLKVSEVAVTTNVVQPVTEADRDVDADEVEEPAAAVATATTDEPTLGGPAYGDVDDMEAVEDDGHEWPYSPIDPSQALLDEATTPLSQSQPSDFSHIGSSAASNNFADFFDQMDSTSSFADDVDFHLPPS